MKDIFLQFLALYFSLTYTLNSAVKESRWNFGEESLEVYLFFMCLCCVAWRCGLWGDRATLNNGGTGTSVTGMCPPGPGTIHTYWGGKIPGATNDPAIILYTSLARSNTVTLGFDCSFRSWWLSSKIEETSFTWVGIKSKLVHWKCLFSVIRYRCVWTWSGEMERGSQHLHTVRILLNQLIQCYVL